MGYPHFGHLHVWTWSNPIRWCWNIKLHNWWSLTGWMLINIPYIEHPGTDLQMDFGNHGFLPWNIMKHGRVWVCWANLQAKMMLSHMMFSSLDNLVIWCIWNTWIIVDYLGLMSSGIFPSFFLSFFFSRLVHCAPAEAGTAAHCPWKKIRTDQADILNYVQNSQGVWTKKNDETWKHPCKGKQPRLVL